MIPVATWYEYHASAFGMWMMLYAHKLINE